MRARTIRWAKGALADYKQTIAHLRRDDPRTAEKYVNAVGKAINDLARRNTGRPGRVLGTFEKSLPRWRYIIAFSVRRNADKSEQLNVLRIIHTSRDWPAGGWPAG